MNDQKRLRILSAALDVFFKYGFKRVNMHDIAAAAGVSRPALYVYFKSKEEVFSAALIQHAHNIIEDINKGLESQKTAEDKILFVFELWSVRNFNLALKSSEAREFSDCSHDFARSAHEETYAMFESI